MTAAGMNAVDAAGVARTRWGPVVALGLAMLVITSEMTITAVTLPGLGADLGVGPAATAWVLLAYALPMAAIAMTVGPAVAALSWTVAGGGTAGFRAGILVLTAAALARSPGYSPSWRPPGDPRAPASSPLSHDLIDHSGRNPSCSKIVSSSR